MTSGGNIVLGGSADIATGNAFASTTNPNLPNYLSGIMFLSGANLTSGGGNVILRGASNINVNAVSSGISMEAATINSGSVIISLTGCVSTTSTFSTNSQGITLGNIGFYSSNTTANVAISLIGNASSSNTGTSLGFNVYGNSTIQANGAGGGIYIAGSAGTGTGYEAGITLQNGTSILSSSGPIAISSNNPLRSAATNYDLMLGNINIGSATGSGVTSLNANVTIQMSDISFTGTTNISTTGAVAILPLATNISVNTSNIAFRNTVSNLTIGASGNNSNITVGSAVNATGPISVYGGNISLSSSIRTTNVVLKYLV